jgi:outer membrane protein assembly factor BamB
VYAIGSDGKLHALYISNGEEPSPAIAFLPPNANAHGLIVIDNVAYVATSGGCGGVDDGLWAVNLESKNVAKWKGSGVAGFAAGPDGILYVAAGSELAALEPGTLKVKSTFKAGKDFTSSPVVFESKDIDLLAVATSDGAIHVFDTAKLNSGPLASTAAFSAAGFASGSLASWRDSAGTRWILAPAAGPHGQVKNGAIVAFKLNESGTPSLNQGWVSRDLVSPLPPAIVNGVVFALSSGEFRSADAKVTAAQRAQRSSKAVLYALDGATGKELWSSGGTIESFVHSGGLSSGGSRVYVAGHDGTQYAFGFPIEH